MRNSRGNQGWRGGGVVSKSNPLVIQLGSVVWAPITPDGGVVKARRSIVIDEPSKDPNETIWVIGVTSDGGKYDPLNTTKYDPRVFFPMPYASDGSNPTTFTIPCAAKVTWVQDFKRSAIQPTKGILAGKVFNELISWLDANEK